MLSQEQIQQIREFLLLEEEPEEAILELIEIELEEGISLKEILTLRIDKESFSNSDFY
jgi:hypothetical protein